MFLQGAVLLPAPPGIRAKKKIACMTSYLLLGAGEGGREGYPIYLILLIHYKDRLVGNSKDADNSHLRSKAD